MPASEHSDFAVGDEDDEDDNRSENHRDIHEDRSPWRASEDHDRHDSAEEERTSPYEDLDDRHIWKRADN